MGDIANTEGETSAGWAFYAGESKCPYHCLGKSRIWRLKYAPYRIIHSPGLSPKRGLLLVTVSENTEDDECLNVQDENVWTDWRVKVVKMSAYESPGNEEVVQLLLEADPSQLEISLPRMRSLVSKVGLLCCGGRAGVGLI